MRDKKFSNSARTAAAASFLITLAAATYFIAYTPAVQGVSNTLVISQVYGGGGNSGATLKNDFLELFNRGTTAVNVAGWSVQYTSASGTTWQVTPLSGTIPSGGYYLVQEAAGAGGTVDLPTPDAIGNIAMSATSGKVALVNNSTTLSGACPTSASIIDLVGYGSANCSEASPTPTLSNTTAALRGSSGCLDTDDNSADFATGAPNPRNSGHPTNDCQQQPTPLAINQIQGTGLSSPLAGQTVTTSGVVTARKSNGFFIQTPDAGVDSDPTTSEGLFVFTSVTPPSAAAVGNIVSVTGPVLEFRPSSDPSSPPLTEISGSVSVNLVSTGNPLPAAITLTAADTDPAGSIEQLERFEGMRIHVDSLTAVAPTQGFVSEPNATSTSNGIFFAVITGLARPLREPGIETPDPLPPGSPCCVPRFDANPERLRVDSDGQTGAGALEVTTGAVITNVTGVVDYGSRTYTILPDPSTPPSVAGNTTAAPLPQPASDEFTVTSINLERFFDTANDPNTSDPVLTQTAFDNRLNKVSLHVRNVLRSPDVIGVQEAENIGALTALGDKINSDTVAAGGSDPGYQAFLVEGNDVGGIDVGLLVKTARVTVLEVTQEGKDATFINPDTGQPETLNDRPPLILRATATPPASSSFPITVIVNHLRSLLGINDPTDGNRVRAKRRAQAEFLANLIQARQAADPAENIISVGDYNAFQFNDGYVDGIGTIKGAPTPSDQVVLASSDLVNPDLTNLVDTISAEQRYSFSFAGNGQVLDHVLVTSNLLPRVTRFHYGRNNADFPESFRNDPGRSERFSDHDNPVAYIRAPLQDPIVISQVYGGGNNNGATFQNDFIELFNRGNVAVNVTGWSVQYASASGSTWQVTTLSGSINPGRYYLVKEAGGRGNLPLPPADATGNISMSASSGKVALVKNSTALSGSCPSSVNIVDLVGYGGANCSEGSPTPNLSKTTAALRKLGGCTDTNNNSADFTVGTPLPRNSSSSPNACGSAQSPAAAPSLGSLVLAKARGKLNETWRIAFSTFVRSGVETETTVSISVETNE